MPRPDIDHLEALVSEVIERGGDVALSAHEVNSLLIYVRELETKRVEALEQLEQWQVADDDTAEDFVARALGILRSQ